MKAVGVVEGEVALITVITGHLSAAPSCGYRAWSASIHTAMDERQVGEHNYPVCLA